MSFYINMEKTGDVAVLQCAGRMVRAQALSLLKDAVTSLSQLRVVVLDLSEVQILDAGGLGVLVSLHNWACVNGIQLKLVNPSKRVRQMLELTRLTSVLHISSVEDVIYIFCRPRYNTYLDIAMPTAWIRFAVQDTVISDRRQSRHQLAS